MFGLVVVSISVTVTLHGHGSSCSCPARSRLFSATVTVLFRVPPYKRPHHDSRPPAVGQHRDHPQRREQSYNTYNATSPNRWFQLPIIPCSCLCSSRSRSTITALLRDGHAPRSRFYSVGRRSRGPRTARPGGRGLPWRVPHCCALGGATLPGPWGPGTQVAYTSLPSRRAGSMIVPTFPWNARTSSGRTTMTSTGTGMPNKLR